MKKPEKLLRNRITIRLDDEQYGRLLDYSEQTGQNINTLIRKLIDKKIPKSVNPKNIQDLIKEVNRIGTNINQISRVANTYHTLSDRLTKNLVNEITKLKEIIKKELIEEDIIENDWYLK